MNFPAKKVITCTKIKSSWIFSDHFFANSHFSTARPLIECEIWIRLQCLLDSNSQSLNWAETCWNFYEICLNTNQHSPHVLIHVRSYSCEKWCIVKWRSLCMCTLHSGTHADTRNTCTDIRKCAFNEVSHSGGTRISSVTIGRMNWCKAPWAVAFIHLLTSSLLLLNLGWWQGEGERAGGHQDS